MVKFNPKIVKFGFPKN